MDRASKKNQEFPKVVNGGLDHSRPSPQPLAPISKTNGARPHKQEAHSNRDLEFACNAKIPSLITKGKYEVVFLRVEKGWLYGGMKVYLHFQIVSPGEFHGKECYMACNVKQDGKWGASSKFYQAWVLAAGRKPDRFDRMSTKVFRDKVFLAQVRVVTTNARNLVRSHLLQYSVIDDLLERLTDSEKI